MNKEKYRVMAAEKGYDEPIERSLEANIFNDSHTHDYALFLYITEGEISVTIDGKNGSETTTCSSGQTIEVPAGVLHTERIGSDGVTILVARK